ncbi:2-hydroxyacid dehydrogenase [Avibacterium avium]|uniref:2-hydroxyacid dehydrogenase n=1 Tax=Avibacterium avium TaxID=751 RepID=UPI003BF81159
MKKTVVLYRKIDRGLVNILQEQFNLIYFEKVNQDNYKQFVDSLSLADGLIGSSLDIKGELIERAKNLKVISTISAGYNNFDIEQLTIKNIRLMNTPRVLTETTADLIFALLLSTARRIVECSNFIQQGKWLQSIDSSLFGMDVHHKKIGILGMGEIGKALAKRAYLGFGMSVLYYNRSEKREVESLYNAKRLELDDLLKESDFVCITLPLNSDTEKLINQEKLALMKPTSILINGGRGKILDQEALIRSLKDRKIFAAGLDVFEQEPLSSCSELLNLPNVVLTPHIGSATLETRKKMEEEAVKNLINAFKEEKPVKNLVNVLVG